MTFTHDEINLLCIYNTGTKGGTLNALAGMREYLEDDEVELRLLTDSVMEKLEKISDDEFDSLDLFPDFEESGEAVEIDIVS